MAQLPSAYVDAGEQEATGKTNKSLNCIKPTTKRAHDVFVHKTTIYKY